ncbi:maleylpyruvate isomerase (plasmid) [Rhodococcus ruber]|nr:maleylpyruvate isomerase [Rhodococcus ruber]
MLREAPAKAVMSRSKRVDRREIAGEFERVRADFHRLVADASSEGFDRPSSGTRWRNEQLLFHMVFGSMVVRPLLSLVRIFGRPPEGVSRRFAAAQNASTRLFDEVNYRGTCQTARVFDRHRMVRHCDKVIDALLRSLAAGAESDLQRGMHFPDRGDPFFADYMTLEDLYRCPARHFDFHRRQLTPD